MADIFISYKREDQEHAKRLAAALEQVGYQVWFDFELISGDKYRSVIRRVIDECAAAIVIWSEKSILSEFVLDEAAHAKSRGKLCPVRIDDAELPFGFGQSHADDLRDWSGAIEHVNFQRLLRSLEIKAGVAKKRRGPTETSKGAHAREEVAAFQAAQATRTASGYRSFLERFPEGGFAPIVREQLHELTSWKGRFNTAPIAARLAILAAAPLLVGAAIYALVVASISKSLNFLGEGNNEPLSEQQLTSLVHRSLLSIEHGECTADTMQATLLAVCRQHVGPMAAAVKALGPIVEVKSEGRHRSVASGGAFRTRILVRYEKGQQRWEVLGHKDGRLETFWSPGG